jgi:phosphoribosylformylglycinamidine synthase subunit PurL
MRIGIIRFPGSNCDIDALQYFPNSFYIWHKETTFPDNIRLLVIPGGFAYGDRTYNTATGSYSIAPGKMAAMSPVRTIIYEAAQRKIPILGICNGFQILIELELLPGKLLLNENETFTCKKVKCIVPLPYGPTNNYCTDLYVANSYGRFSLEHTPNPTDALESLHKHNQIILQYSADSVDNGAYEINSLDNIAGICNTERTVFGMMPHPERNNSDYKAILYNMLFPSSLMKTRGFMLMDQIVKIPYRIHDLMDSEHISYKSTRKFLKQLHTKEDWVVQGPGENAGIIDIGNDYCIAARIESHNHPTFINPFEGAATGVGGIIRDIFTMGARPIAILDFLRFGVDSNSANLLQNAVKGISYYGNCVGVANIGGDCYVHQSYNTNPLVNVACLGIMKKEHIVYGRGTCETQSLIYVGSKTGYEGVGGAAMASNTFASTQNLAEMEKTIQKSDPFLEKLLLEACLEIAENKLAIGMQDMGAGGLLCATYEVISRGREKTKRNLGGTIHLDRVPTKYQMEPADILMSESQERMLIVADKEQEKAIFEIFRKWDLEYCTIGEITNDGMYNVFYEDVFLYTEPMKQRKDVIQEWTPRSSELSFRNYPKKLDVSELRKQYDSTIGNRTVYDEHNHPDDSHKDIKDYSVLNLPEINRELIVTWGENITTMHKIMTKQNGIPMAVINCLNYGHPRDKLHELSSTLETLNYYSQHNYVPIIGGNVSLYNCTDARSIRSTPIFVLIGLR